MKKKYVFIDLDGTILDYNTRSVPESTKKALKLARENGHELVLTTGRPPSIFYGIDIELGFSSYIACNGRVVVYHDTVIFERPIEERLIEQVVKIGIEEQLDIAYEGLEIFTLESQYNDLYKRFCDHFNLRYPELEPGSYKGTNIYQMNLFYDKPDFKRFETLVPELSFEFSCKYGLDVNTPGGYKDVGIRVFEERFHLSKDDIIAIGDGYNDISMLKYAGTSVAMGNAYDGVKEHATFVTSNIEEDGLYKAFERLKLI